MDARGIHAAQGDESPLQLKVTEQLCQSIAHDLRGVLMAIQLAAEELTTSVVEVAELQNEIQTSIERATRLASELSALARPTLAHSEVIDVGLLIDPMQRMLRRNVGPKTRVELELTQVACHVATAPMAMKRLLLTLFNCMARGLPAKEALVIETRIADIASNAPGSCSRVIVSVGDVSSRAVGWPCGKQVPEKVRDAPHWRALFALVQHLDAELYCQGSLENPSHFWLSLPRAKPSSR